MNDWKQTIRAAFGENFWDEYKEKLNFPDTVISIDIVKSSLEESQNGLLICDLFGNILFSNKSILNQLGLQSPEILIHQNVSSLINSPGRNFLDYLDIKEDDDVLYDSKINLSKINEQSKELFLNVHLVYNYSKYPIGLIFIFKLLDNNPEPDVINKIKNNFYEFISDCSSKALVILKILYSGERDAINFTVLEMSSEFETLSGLTRKSSIGNTLSEIIPSMDEEWKQKIADVNNSLEPIEFTTFSTYYNKSYNIRAIPIDKDTVLVIANEAEKLFSDSQLIFDNKKLFYFKEAVEQSPAIVMITDKVGNILYVNKKFINITGYSFEEVLGKKPSILKSGHTSEEEYKALWKTISLGKEWKGEFLNKKKNGELYWEKIYISPIFNNEGQIENFLSTKEEITEIKKSKEELSDAINRADQANKVKTEFLAQMSHEIRTPINAILSFTSLLKDDLYEMVDEDIKQSFNVIKRAGNRIIRTIDLLLNMSEIQTGAYEPEFIEFDIFEETVSNVYSEYLMFAKDKNLKLSIQKNCSETTISTDEFAVRQILDNLVDNAVKFTEKGFIDIKVSRDEKNKLVVEVCDTGIGINDDYIIELFTPFSQEEKGYTRKYEGNGLGLALVKKYCEVNDYSIEVKTKKGEGTIMRLKI